MLRTGHENLLNIEYGFTKIEVANFWSGIQERECVVALHILPATDPMAVEA